MRCGTEASKGACVSCYYPFLTTMRKAAGRPPGWGSTLPLSSAGLFPPTTPHWLELCFNVQLQSMSLHVFHQRLLHVTLLLRNLFCFWAAAISPIASPPPRLLLPPARHQFSSHLLWDVKLSRHSLPFPLPVPPTRRACSLLYHPLPLSPRLRLLISSPARTPHSPSIFHQRAVLNARH